jgi:hypothetical protein
VSEHPIPEPSGYQSVSHELTGHLEVDAVVAALEELDGRPVAEHVAVFESAHDRLRAALADAGNDRAGA